MLLNVIRDLALEGFPILIIGDGWHKSNLTDIAKNAFVYDPPYEHYNYFYNMMRVFCSVTSYDGGPIPLLESMSTGVYPVITNSGFAPDVIKSPDMEEFFSPSQHPNICNLAVPFNEIDRNLLRELYYHSFDSFVLISYVDFAELINVCCLYSAQYLPFNLIVFVSTFFFYLPFVHNYN